MYISLMQKRSAGQGQEDPAQAAAGHIKPVADEKTLEALIANRYEVMAGYARELAQGLQALPRSKPTRPGRPMSHC
jgi:stearoyl-CoA desaturase (delta-9 desaturase)